MTRKWKWWDLYRQKLKNFKQIIQQDEPSRSNFRILSLSQSGKNGQRDSHRLLPENVRSSDYWIALAFEQNEKQKASELEDRKCISKKILDIALKHVYWCMFPSLSPYIIQIHPSLSTKSHCPIHMTSTLLVPVILTRTFRNYAL